MSEVTGQFTLDAKIGRHTTSTNIWRAVVQTIRSSALKAALKGGIHQSFAPEKVPYPFAVYEAVAAPYEDDWGHRMIIAAFDLFIFSRDPVEADNLDLLAITVLDGASPTVAGQTTLICRRIMDVPMPPDVDEEGKKVYQVGGTYEFWTDQPL
jgi:hypothetical protein